LQSKTEKIVIGHKLKRLRQSLSISQLDMARELEISASYLNLLENNQRPITVHLLFRIGQLYNIDFKEFSDDETGKITAELNEVFSEPVINSNDISKREIKNLASSSPTISNAIINLHDAYRKLREEIHVNNKNINFDMKSTPMQSVRLFLTKSKNYFSVIEQATKSIRSKANIKDNSSMFMSLENYLEEAFKIEIKVLPQKIMESLLSRNDPHRSRILISESLNLQERVFQISSQLALIEFEDAIDEIINKSNLTNKEEKYILKISLASYFGLSLMMPYDEFKNSAQEVRHDLETLATRFSVSFDQVCQRLTTLNRRNDTGIPFFYFKFNEAGHITNRLSSSDIKFPYYAGANPDWAVHQAFRAPGKIFAQLSEMDDGKKFINISKTIKPPRTSTGEEETPLLSAILGCDIRHAENIIYAEKIIQNKSSIISKIELGCRICGMNVCEHRDQGPASSLSFDPNMRYRGLFEFSN